MKRGSTTALPGANMPRLRMRTMGVADVQSTVTRPWSTSGWRNAQNWSTAGRTGGGGASTGAARTICGIFTGGTFSMRANRSSDAALRLSENQTNSTAMTESAALAATQTGTVARAGRYGAATPLQCGERSGSAVW